MMIAMIAKVCNDFNSLTPASLHLIARVNHASAVHKREIDKNQKDRLGNKLVLA